MAPAGFSTSAQLADTSGAVVSVALPVIVEIIGIGLVISPGAAAV
jgi:hypothetical protein